MELKGNVIRQDGTELFVTTMRAADLLERMKIDVWGKDDQGEKGYQRMPEPGRMRAVARYLRTERKALMPTTILLNARQPLDYDEEADGTGTLHVPEDVTLWVVDGQHRLGGFEYAIRNQGYERFNDYTLPVVIMIGLPTEEEAEQFRVINETAKKVRTDLARRLLAFVSRSSREGRLQIRVQGRVWEAAAAEVIDVLNSHDDSAWRGRIQQPNEKKNPGHTIRELSFSTSLRPILNTFPYQDWRPARVAELLKGYWKAWEALVPGAFVEPHEYVLLRTPGVFSLHQVALHVWEVCRRRGIEPDESEVRHILEDLGEYVTESYWVSDNIEGAAVFGSMKGFAILADLMKEALIDAGHSTE